MALPYSIGGGARNYSPEALRHLIRLFYDLSVHDALILFWCRYANLKGNTRGYMARDMLNEKYVKILKQALIRMSSGLSFAHARKLSLVSYMLNEISSNLEENVKVSYNSPNHTVPDKRETIAKLADVINKQYFVNVEVRKCKTPIVALYRSGMEKFDTTLLSLLGRMRKVNYEPNAKLSVEQYRQQLFEENDTILRRQSEPNDVDYIGNDEEIADWNQPDEPTNMTGFGETFVNETDLDVIEHIF